MVRTRTAARLVTALLLLVGWVAVATPAAAATSYTNPVKSQKGADPWLEFYNGNYYLITTTFTNVFVMRRSPTLAGLATAPSIRVWQDNTPSRGTNFWAPEIHLSGGRWYLYQSAGVADVANCGTADGTDVRQWAWLNNTCQQWLLNPV